MVRPCSVLKLTHENKDLTKARLGQNYPGSWVKTGKNMFKSLDAELNHVLQIKQFVILLM